MITNPVPNLAIFAKNSEANEYDVTAGLHGPLPREEYDSLPCLSNTVIKKWSELEATPAEFAWWLKERWEDTDSSSALSKGSALDCLLLEDDRSFRERFHVFTAAGAKKITKAHRDANPGKIVLSHSEGMEVVEMAKALHGSPHTDHGKDFRHGKKQVAIAELFGVPFKCEFDFFEEHSQDIVDIKTARAVTPAAFGKAAADYSYFQQASLYLAIARELGFDKQTFNFLVVKNAAPYTVLPYRFRPFKNAQHMALFDGCMSHLESSTLSLLEAMRNGFQDDLQWRDIEAPAWYANTLRYNETTRYIPA